MEDEYDEIYLDVKPTKSKQSKHKPIYTQKHVRIQAQLTKKK